MKIEIELAEYIKLIRDKERLSSALASLVIHLEAFSEEYYKIPDPDGEDLPFLSESLIKQSRQILDRVIENETQQCSDIKSLKVAE